MASWCAVDRYVVVERGDIHVKGLVGIVIEDRRDKNRGQHKGRVQIEYSAPTGSRQVKTGWYHPGCLIDGSAHEQAFNAAQGRGELYRLEVEREVSESDSSSDGSSVSGPAPAPAPAAPRRSGRENAGQLFEALQRCDQCDACLRMIRPPPGCKCSSCRGVGRGTCDQVRKAQESPPDCYKWVNDNAPLPAIRADEQGSRRRGDPESDETGKLRDIFQRIRHNQPPGGDGVRYQEQHATAVFATAAPGMIATARNVIKQIGADATNDDLAEFVVSYLEENCLKLDGSGYLDEDELAVLKRLVRAAAAKPDLEEASLVRCGRATCGACQVVAVAQNDTYRDARAKKSAVNKAVRQNPCRQKIPEQVNDYTRQTRTWRRISNDLYAHLRGKILALEEGSVAEDDWIRDRARVAVDMRREQRRIAGDLADWRPGLAAANRALARGTWSERAKGVIHNNDVPHLAARWELNYFAISDDVPYMHEI